MQLVCIGAQVQFLAYTVEFPSPLYYTAQWKCKENLVNF